MFKNTVIILIAITLSLGCGNEESNKTSSRHSIHQPKERREMPNIDDAIKNIQGSNFFQTSVDCAISISMIKVDKKSIVNVGAKKFELDAQDIKVNCKNNFVTIIADGKTYFQGKIDDPSSGGPGHPSGGSPTTPFTVPSGLPF